MGDDDGYEGQWVVGREVQGSEEERKEGGRERRRERYRARGEARERSDATAVILPVRCPGTRLRPYWWYQKSCPQPKGFTEGYRISHRAT